MEGEPYCDTWYDKTYDSLEQSRAERERESKLHVNAEMKF